MRHGITRVYRQVHDDLLDLSGIGFHGADLRTRNHDQVDVFTNQAGQHFKAFCDYAVKVHNFGRKHLLTAECQ